MHGAADRFHHIECLRGIAIIFVILFHAFPKKIGMGYLGVDVFLVISGYFLFFKPLDFRSSKNIGGVCLGFLKKKAQRILIPLSVAVLSTLVVSSFILIPDDFEQTCRTAVSSLFCTTNIYLDYISSDYFAPSLNFNPLVPMWYLSVICQIYLLFLAGSLLLSRLGKCWILSILAGIGLISFSFSFIPILNHLLVYMGCNPINYSSLGYYSTTARLWEILLGGAVLLLPCISNKKVSTCLALLGVAMIIVPCLTDGSSGKNIKVLLAVVGTMLTIRYGAALAGGKNILTSPLRWLGCISFSAYLLHMLVIVLAWSTIGYDSLGKCVAFFGIVLLVSWLFYRCVERRKTLSPKWWIVYAAAVVCSLSLLVFDPVRCLFQEDCPRYTPYTQWEVPEDASLAKGLDREIIKPANEIERISAGNPPEADLLILGGGDAQSPYRFVLMGDSHAAAFFPGLAEYCLRKRIKGLYLNTYVVPFHNHLRQGLKSQRWDREKEAALLHWFECHPELDTIILSSRWSLSLNGKPNPVAPGYSDLSENSLRLFLQSLKQIGKKVIIITPVPEFRASLLKRSYILSEHRGVAPQRRLLVCSKEDYETRMAVPMASLNALENEGFCKLLHIEYSLFADGAISAHKDGEWMMLDGDHLSPEGARRVIRGCEKELDALLNVE